MKPTDQSDADGNALAKLIARAGSRPTASSLNREHVRFAAHEAWQHALHQRRQRQRLLAAGIAAVATVALGSLLHFYPGAPAAPAVVARLAYAQGEVQLRSTYAPGTAQHDAATRNQLHPGDEILTGSNSGARIAVTNGVTVRIAADTEVRWRSPGEFELAHGAVYIDSGVRHAPLKVHTAFGDVSHLGTRYLVRTDTEALHVAVRDGLITLAANGTETQAGGHERLDVGTDGRVLRSVAAPYGDEWGWSDALNPGFNVDGRNLAEFLTWASGESGRRLEYADEAVHAAAMHTVLHGRSVAISPDEALSAILPTTDFSALVVGERVIVTRK
jgi:ferric-dicitrate binding protein FerR (iron transport regulator)